MSRVTIEVDNVVLANAIALWFEDGDAIDAFNHDQEQTLDALRENGELTGSISYASVQYGRPMYGTVSHDVRLITEDEDEDGDEN